MMRYALVPLVIAVTTAMLFSSITPARACSCAAPPPVSERVQQADVVVLGTVIGLRTEGFVFSVDRYLKGSGPTPILVRDPPPNLPPTSRQPGEPILLSSCTSLDHRVLNREFLFILHSGLFPDGTDYGGLGCWSSGAIALDSYVGDGADPRVTEIKDITGEGRAPFVEIGVETIDANLEAERLQIAERPPPSFEPQPRFDGNDFPVETEWAVVFALPLAFIAAAMIWVRVKRRWRPWG